MFKGYILDNASVTNKGWQDEKFENVLVIVLKAAPGLLMCIFCVFVGFVI